MADIFVSYKSDDRGRAQLVAQTLVAEGLDVWWDPALQAGEDYQEVIDRNLRDALVVVVLWSPMSVKSRWVRSEATIGDRYGALAPAMIAACDLPIAFVLVQAADLTQWSGDRNDPKWREFAKDVIAKRDQRRRDKASNTAAPAPDSGQIESLFWQTVMDSTDAADFESYMRRYPNGHFSDLARSKLAHLTGSKRGRGVVVLGAAAVVSAALAVGFLVFGRNLIAGAPVLTAADAADPAVIAAPLVGRWAPEGLSCADAVTITVADGQLSLAYSGAPPSLEAIAGRGPDSSVRTRSNGADFYYSASGDKLTLRDSSGAAATFNKCAG